MDAASKRRTGPANRWGVLLAPGASAGSDQPALVAIGRAVEANGFTVRRMDFPYRLAGRRAPDRPEVLVAAVREAARSLATAKHLDAGRVFAGGRSMGGRMCSMAVAEGMPAAGLVLVSYPLHPPGRPEGLRLRTSHFDRLTVPCLFISGTRDSFASPAELEEAVASIPGPVTVRFVEGADHGMRRRDEEVADAVVCWLGEQVQRRP